MAFSDTLAALRKRRNLTQEELAARLYVTRQAVSRWETGETAPGIDMVKLIAVTLGVPVSCLLEMPDHPVCQSCGMPLDDPAERGSESDGTPSCDYCRHCYHEGAFAYDSTMDELIEACAPYLVQYSGMSLDEAISFMGAMLPGLKRWRDGAGAHGGGIACGQGAAGSQGAVGGQGDATESQDAAADRERR